jgi:hypothetical protein
VQLIYGSMFMVSNAAFDQGLLHLQTAASSLLMLPVAFFYEAYSLHLQIVVIIDFKIYI